MERLLVTFGCSWVYGQGVNYKENMSYDDFKKDINNTDLCNRLSFRNILSQNYNRNNLNFAENSSSNQRQFRLAEEYFLSKSNRWFANRDIVVLWGITSVYRNELFNNKKKTYDNFSLGERGIGKMFLKEHFDYNEELKKLSGRMKFFNYFFKDKKIKNFWFTSFNDHIYQYDVENLLFNGHSLLNLLINNYGTNDSYHWNNWGEDYESMPTDKNIKKAIELKVVDPYSCHPTKESHQKIADFFIKELKI